MRVLRAARTRSRAYTPRHIHVITGDGEHHTEKLSDYSAYYRVLKARYEELVLGAPDTSTYPEPVDHCGVCRWADVCTSQWRADDHLSLVAGMRRDQTRKLVAADVCTTTELAGMDRDPHVEGIGDPTCERLRHQAELQVASRGLDTPLVEVLEPERPPADADASGARRPLSLVAGMRRDQTRKLVAADVCTTTELAGMDHDPHVEASATPPASGAPPGGAPVTTAASTRLVEVLEPERPPADADPDEPWLKRGFAALPAPSPGDVFLDLEGDPYALDGDNLEYLFGVVDRDDDGELRYQAFWAHDRDEERAAFEAVIDLIMDKLAADPDMHVYHYAPYETTAVKRLMGAHGTRETEVDVLLRGERFVDLYTVLRQGVRVGTESYSLKSIEQLYMERPPGAGHGRRRQHRRVRALARLARPGDPRRDP